MPPTAMDIVRMFEEDEEAARRLSRVPLSKAVLDPDVRLALTTRS